MILNEVRIGGSPPIKGILVLKTSSKLLAFVTILLDPFVQSLFILGFRSRSGDGVGWSELCTQFLHQLSPPREVGLRESYEGYSNY